MKSLSTVMVLIGALLMSQLAVAELGEKHDEKWKKDHPRQAEVNQRLQNQQNRIQKGQANGTLNAQQAQKINNQDHKIYNEEQNMKARNGGNAITPAQQAKLNRQENHVSNEIKRDESKNATPTAGAPTSTAPTTPSN